MDGSTIPATFTLLIQRLFIDGLRQARKTKRAKKYHGLDCHKFDKMNIRDVSRGPSSESKSFLDPLARYTGIIYVL